MFDIFSVCILSDFYSVFIFDDEEDNNSVDDFLFF